MTLNLWGYEDCPIMADLSGLPDEPHAEDSTVTEMRGVGMVSAEKIFRETKAYYPPVDIIERNKKLDGLVGKEFGVLRTDVVYRFKTLDGAHAR